MIKRINFFHLRSNISPLPWQNISNFKHFNISGQNHNVVKKIRIFIFSFFFFNSQGFLFFPKLTADIVLHAIHVLRLSKIHDFYHSLLPLLVFRYICLLWPPPQYMAYFINDKVSSTNFMIRSYVLVTDVYRSILGSPSLSLRRLPLLFCVRHIFSYFAIRHPPLYFVI